MVLGPAGAEISTDQPVDSSLFTPIDGSTVEWGLQKELVVTLGDEIKLALLLVPFLSNRRAAAIVLRSSPARRDSIQATSGSSSNDTMPMITAASVRPSSRPAFN